MSNEYSAHMSDSEVEPSENDYDSNDESANENLPTNSNDHSDDDSNDTPTMMPVTASGVAEPPQLPIHNTRGPIMITTARKTIRRPPTVQFAPPNETSTEPEEQPVEPPLKRLRVEHLSWMPGLLRHWRTTEGIPSTFEIGESSRAPQSHPITEEPLELTVPTLVAMTNSNVRNLHEIGINILELQSDTSRLDGDMISTYERLETIEDRMAADGETAQATQARMEALENRARAAEVVAGVCLLMTGVVAAMAMYLSYPH